MDEVVGHADLGRPYRCDSSEILMALDSPGYIMTWQQVQVEGFL